MGRMIVRSSGSIVMEQIFVIVAIRMVRSHSTEEANGFVRTAMVHELVGPERFVKSNQVNVIN